MQAEMFFFFCTNLKSWKNSLSEVIVWKFPIIQIEGVFCEYPKGKDACISLVFGMETNRKMKNQDLSYQLKVGRHTQIEGCLMGLVELPQAYHEKVEHFWQWKRKSNGFFFHFPYCSYAFGQSNYSSEEIVDHFGFCLRDFPRKKKVNSDFQLSVVEHSHTWTFCFWITRRGCRSLIGLRRAENSLEWRVEKK